MKFPKIDQKHTRLIALIISSLGILALLLITSSISSIKFLPGESIDFSELVLPLPDNLFNYIDLLVSLCISGFVIIIPILILLLTSSAKARDYLKKKTIGLFGFLLLLIVISFMIDPSDEAAPQMEEPLVMGSQSGDGELDDTYPISEEIEPLAPNNLPGWQGYVLGFIIFISLGVAVYKIWDRNRSIKFELNKIALKTMADIQSGQNWEDAVIQCYAQMSSAVSRKRNLQRMGSMTPLEFSDSLIKSGLPETPVKTLTQLFEKARYSNRTPHTKEANQAVACLSQITRWLDLPK